MTVDGQSLVNADELTAMLAALVGDDARVAWLPTDASNLPMLTTAEAQVVERAVPHRQAEFATGRRLLRQLMGTNVEILRHPTGAPKLPDGVIATLAHDREVVVAAIATSPAGAIGIDIEPAHEIDDKMAAIIVRDDDVAPDPITAFVAKEAAYKAWSVLGGELLEHHEVRVTIDGVRYQARMRDHLLLEGRLGRADGRIAAFVTSPATSLAEE